MSAVFVKLANNLPFMAILIICGLAFIFAKIVFMPYVTGANKIQLRIPRVKMMTVHIPFTFKLQETSKPMYDAVECRISSQASYNLEVYWGVSITKFQKVIWQSLASQLDGKLGYYQEKGPSYSENCHEEKCVRLNFPETPLDLGRPPRFSYPCVVFLIKNNLRTHRPEDVVALINVVHIKDSICTLPTVILAQYLKQANGRLFCLKQLYFSVSNPLSCDSRLKSTDEENYCVVCQDKPLSCALLPCRHTCVCAHCFEKLDTCPMCRSSIKSYFLIRSEEIESGI